MEDFIRPDYKRRDAVKYCHRPDDAYQRQLEVYQSVAWVSSQRVVDVGCGYGEKVIDLFPGRFITGIDFGANIDVCNQRNDGGCWKSADLESDALDDVEIDQHTVVVCADVVEHINNLSPIMSFLLRASRTAAAVAISTPERELLRGVDHVGPPTNECHVREWSLLEFNNFLDHWGISARYGLCRASEGSDRPSTILALCGRVFHPSVNVS